MANIIGLKERQNALREIEEILKDLKIVNGFLAAQASSKVCTISYTDENGKKQKTELTASAGIDEIVNQYKAEKREHVLHLAEENKIALDPEDNEILGI